MTPFRVLYTGDWLDENGAVKYGDIGLSRLDAAANVERGFTADHAPRPGEADYSARLYAMEVTPQHVAAADGLVIFRPWVKAGAFADGAGRLTVIGRAGAGYDKIDLDACTANDVAVYNAPDTLTHSTASSALLLMLALAKRLPQQQRVAASGSWTTQSALTGDDLPGQTLGIVGLGKSGMELARLVAPFAMRVVAFSPRADAAGAAELGVTLLPTLEAVMRTSDYVSLHNRLDARTRRMIGARELGWMKPTAYFVNVARGELVDQAALVRCLRERAIAGAGLDVFEKEPLPVDDPLQALDNVILTPHWLPTTHQAAVETMAQMANGILRAASGQVPANVVNRDVLDRPGFRRKLARFGT